MESKKVCDLAAFNVYLITCRKGETKAKRVSNAWANMKEEKAWHYCIWQSTIKESSLKQLFYLLPVGKPWLDSNNSLFSIKLCATTVKIDSSSALILYEFDEGCFFPNHLEALYYHYMPYKMASINYYKKEHFETSSASITITKSYSLRWQ